MSSLVNCVQSELKKIVFDHFFVAISSGKDSVALAHALYSLGYPLTLLHVNYHLRGEESNEDQRWLENFAQSINTPLIVHDVKIPLATLNKGNIQQLARDIRYSFFEQERKKINNSCILVGHHQQDQIENFWIHLFRNSGRSGLKGMSLSENQVVRPMLNVKPNEIEEYMAQHELGWREDSSNKKSIYLRNSIRNRLIPELSQTFSSLRDAILLIQEKLREQEIEDKNSLQKFLVAYNGIFPLKELKAFSDDKLLLFLKHFSLKGSQIMEFRNFLGAHSGSLFEVNKQATFHKDRTKIILNIGEELLPKYAICVDDILQLPRTYNKSSLFLNSEKLKGQPFIRFWKEGDRIFPLGMNGSKLLSDVFTAAKIPNSKKTTIPIICDEDHILWCYELAIDRRKIATEKDKKLTKITLLTA